MGLNPQAPNSGDGDEAGVPDIGDEGEDSGPERRCVVTGAHRPKAELLRFAVSPEGEVVPDLGQGLPGRGIWLSPRRDVVNTAVAKKLFARAARRQVSVSGDLADRVEALLVRRCLDDIGLARRAGQAVMGFEKVCAEVRAGRAALLIAARDAARDGRDKVRGLAPALPVIEVLDGTELGTVFGRDQAVHACVSPGKLARRLIEISGLLAGFRQGGSDRPA
ncbi:RNA-binding protein [Magnetospirillum sp. SS-4]|uniref:RNA-binding protein n=1 Tax=Magnetospirillum sp. SS-4 TaxID=2681465 RepID=UPI0013820D84|nr:RNA-binding protein [Magnetospirillum sp. SS-4]CAA7617600.1 Predicted nucleic-acid-binding protein implicated in transcription termination [Magnetospirillum sp. SS-4]